MIIHLVSSTLMLAQLFTTLIYSITTLKNLRFQISPLLQAAITMLPMKTSLQSMADDSPRFKSTDTDFSPSVGSTNFDEVSLFTNAVRTLQWLLSLGYEDFGSNRIEIVVHDKVSNNALYQPDNSRPMIKKWVRVMVSYLPTCQLMLM